MDDYFAALFVIVGALFFLVLGFGGAVSGIRKDCLIKKEFKVDGVVFTCQLKEQQTK